MPPMVHHTKSTHLHCPLCWYAGRHRYQLLCKQALQQGQHRACECDTGRRGLPALCFKVGSRVHPPGAGMFKHGKKNQRFYTLHNLCHSIVRRCLFLTPTPARSPPHRTWALPAPAAPRPGAPLAPLRLPWRCCRRQWRALVATQAGRCRRCCGVSRKGGCCTSSIH